MAKKTAAKKKKVAAKQKVAASTLSSKLEKTIEKDFQACEELLRSGTGRSTITGVELPHTAPPTTARPGPSRTFWP